MSPSCDITTEYRLDLVESGKITGEERLAKTDQTDQVLLRSRLPQWKIVLFWNQRCSLAAAISVVAVKPPSLQWAVYSYVGLILLRSNKVCK